VSDINTALVDRLKALDPNRPIREADIGTRGRVSILRNCYGIVRIQVVNALLPHAHKRAGGYLIN